MAEEKTSARAGTDGEQKLGMSFLGHLEELRWRLVRMAAAIILAAIFIFIYTTELVEHVFLNMTTPDFITFRAMCKLSMMLGMEQGLCVGEIPVTYQSTDPAGQMNVNIYFAFIGGIIVVFPYIFYQVWSFIKPALKDKEKKAARGIIFYTSILFFLGILFGYFVVTPMSVQFFGQYQLSPKVQNEWDISTYMTFITTTTFYTGLLFELPVIVYIFSRLGLMTPEFMRKYRKHAIVVILILAAIITPPDVTSQILVSLPVVLLYEASIRISARVKKSRDAREAAGG
jgi:sec-independent protein translocase protein TatC